MSIKGKGKGLITGACILGVLLAGVMLYNRITERRAEEALQEADRLLMEQDAAENSTSSDIFVSPGGQTAGDGSLFEQMRAPLKEISDKGNGIIEYRGQQYKRASNIKTVLVMGIDRGDKLDGPKGDDPVAVGRSDALGLIVYDTARNTVKVLMIPRDSIGEIDLLDKETYEPTGERILDHVHFAFVHGDGYIKSCENEVRAVSRLLGGIDIDSYFASDYAVIEELNDLVGGVTVTIPNEELVKAYPRWVMGSIHKLSGEEAKKFVSYRDTSVENSIMFRQQQHRAYMLGFYEALRSASRKDPGIVEKLFDTMQGYMLTDMSKDQYLKLAMDIVLSGSLTNDNIISLPGTILPQAEEDMYQVYIDYEQAIPMLIDLLYRKV